MIKFKERTESKSCFNRAHEQEMMFVLLQRDHASPVAIRAWIAERIRIGKNKPLDAQIVEAETTAQIMENYLEAMR